MLKMLYTIPQYYRDKKIFIWDVKRNSMVIFAMLAFRGIRVAGFVTKDQRYVGESFFNRPVCGIEQLENDNDIMLVAADEYLRDELPKQWNVFYCNELLRIDSELENKHVIIYGAGGGAKDLYGLLSENHIHVQAFCQTNRNKSTYMGLPVLSLDEVPVDERYAVIVSAKNEIYKSEMQYNLEQKGISSIYIEEFIPKDEIFQGTFIQSLYKAIKDRRRIFVYTKLLDENTKLIIAMLKLYQIEVEGCLYKEECTDPRIKSVWEIAYMDLSNIFIIVNETDPFQFQDACELLESIGFSMGHFDYTGNKIIAYEYKKRNRSVYDSLLGYSDYGSMPGFHIYGNQTKSDIRILILGNSTSHDGALRETCWPKMLYQKFAEDNIQVCIFNGAHPGHDIVQELLRLLRDGWALKPNYIVSMSGARNTIGTYSEIKNKFFLEHLIRQEKDNLEIEYCHGIENEEDNFDFWLRMERIMKAIAEVYGAAFFCYLQPMKFGKENASLFEECVHNDRKRAADCFRRKSSDNDFYKNLVDIFDYEDGMFVDACHYTKQANAILADIVFKDIKERMGISV